MIELSAELSSGALELYRCRRPGRLHVLCICDGVRAPAAARAGTFRAVIAPSALADGQRRAVEAPLDVLRNDLGRTRHGKKRRARRALRACAFARAAGRSAVVSTNASLRFVRSERSRRCRRARSADRRRRSRSRLRRRVRTALRAGMGRTRRRASRSRSSRTTLAEPISFVGLSPHPPAARCARRTARVSRAFALRCDRVLRENAQPCRPGIAGGRQRCVSRFARRLARRTAPAIPARGRSREDSRETLRALLRSRGQRTAADRSRRGRPGRRNVAGRRFAERAAARRRTASHSSTTPARRRPARSNCCARFSASISAA